jgi:hypothetical protein
MSDMEKKVNELILQVQQLEQRVADLENGEFGTGVYLDGCTEADAEYIKSKKDKKDEKEGE